MLSGRQDLELTYLVPESLDSSFQLFYSGQHL